MIQQRYILTSQSFSGTVIFGYEDDKLMYYRNESEMTIVQHQWLWKNFPWSKSKLDEIKPSIKGKLEMIPNDLSFDVFWNAYTKKVNRKRCEPLWRKMSDADKIVCLMSIKSYDAFLKRNTGRPKLDPENYLRKASYENNWNAL